MMPLETILNSPGQGEHLGDDGLIHCDACGAHRQTRLNLGDREMTVRCLCPCQKQEQDRRREQARQMEEMDRFARLRSAAMRDPSLRCCTFEASTQDSSAMDVARNYVNHWEEMARTGQGLLLWGKVGTGKSYIAACIANALLDRKIPVLMTSFGRIIGSLPGPASGEQTAAIDALMDYPLLILDDLGVERDTPYTTELVYHIIDARYRSGKPMIITTNLSMEELENPDTREKARIYDRVLERCTGVRADGARIRRGKAKENAQRAKQLLR